MDWEKMCAAMLRMLKTLLRAPDTQHFDDRPMHLMCQRVKISGLQTGRNSRLRPTKSFQD